MPPVQKNVKNFMLPTGEKEKGKPKTKNLQKLQAFCVYFSRWN